MKLKDLCPHSFKSIGEEIGLKVTIFDGRLVIHPPMWRQALSANSEFCQALVTNGYLTEAQMLHAVLRYRLGATKTGGVIYWQINQHEEICEGKLMHYLPNCHRNKSRNVDWVGSVISRRHGWGKLPSRHCFFGLHILSKSIFATSKSIQCLDKRFKPLRPLGNLPIAIVEAEKTAVILSEIYPQYIWLAAGGLTQLQIEKFRPLHGRRLVLFPDTDPTGEAYKLWYETAQIVQHELFWEDSPPIYVSDLLERQASDDQKARKIDLADYWIENLKNK